MIGSCVEEQLRMFLYRIWINVFAVYCIVWLGQEGILEEKFVNEVGGKVCG